MTNTSKRRSTTPGKARPQSAASGASAPGSKAADPEAAKPAGSAGAAVAPAAVVGRSTSGRSLRWAVRILLIEAIVVGVLTLVSIWAAVAADNVSMSSALATPAFAALCTAILAGLAVALRRGKGLARGPAIVIEMLMIPMGYYMIAAGLTWLGVPTMIFGLAGAVFLLAPSTRVALGLETGPRR